MDATIIAQTARLLADPARATMLLALFDVDGLPASSLAHAANISPQTASSHLHKLQAGGLLNMEKHGRHRYYRLANAEVAQTVESLMAISNKAAADEPQDDALEPIQYARTCYDHLAGKVGVLLADSLVKQGWLELSSVSDDSNFTLTSQGEAGFHNLGIDTTTLRHSRRQFARQCLDWTERRYHLAGALGAALTAYVFEQKWLLTCPNSRVVHLTNEGRKGFQDVFSVAL
ncbi:MAG: helix-turn-helix transcriptional regulator [Deinococcota bacterium]